VSAIERLKEKVDSWKAKIRELQESNEALTKENTSLKEELEHCRSKESHEVESLREQLASKEEAILMGLVGTTVFGSAISMSGTVVADYKNSLYIGNRPYHISKGNIMGVVPGSILGAGIAIFLSILLAEGKIDLIAPQANAFATFTILLAEGEGDLKALALGFALGCFAEWATGMGTSFGLGMYLPTLMTFPMLIGGGARDWWEERKLKPKVEKIAENKRRGFRENLEFSKTILALLSTSSYLDFA